MKMSSTALALLATAWAASSFAAGARAQCNAWSSEFSVSGLGAGTATAQIAYYDGSGPALFVGGSFATIAGITANGIAKWNGSSWSALGSGMGGEPVVGWMNVLAAYDDGSGPALFVGGNISTAGGVAANYIAKWDGASWSSLGSGLSSRPLAFAEYDDGSGAALYVGGSFLSALDSGDSFLAKWSCNLDLDTSPPTLSCPSSVLVGDRIGTPPGEIVTFSVTASDCKDPSPQIVCVPPSGSFFPIGTTLVTCTATDAFGNRSSCRFPVTVARGIRPPPR
jgi:hypothetical protein